MQSHTATRQVLIVISLLLIACTLSILSSTDITEKISALFAREQKHIQYTEESEVVRTGLPTTLIIPKINVFASIESVGLTPAGALDVPQDPANAGWFSLGPRPGETGNALIDGHFGWKDGLPAVFDSLSQVEIGDTVLIQDAEGGTIRFVVRAIEIYQKDADTSLIFNTEESTPRLILITCQGTWDEVTQSYSDRLVVFADKVTHLTVGDF